MATGWTGSRSSGGGKKNKNMKRTLLIVALLSALAACNTVEGVGEDISASARTVRNTF